jgi:dTDP-glucose 4,6-dehydratase
MATLIITGGAGFIGSNAVNFFFQRGHRVVVVDKLTYAADVSRLPPETEVYKEDILDLDWKGVIDEHKPQAVLNFAAESHVDRSIQDTAGPVFVNSNILGVYKIVQGLRAAQHRADFIQVSTDEVLGDFDLDPETRGYCELDRLKPGNLWPCNRPVGALLDFNPGYKNPKTRERILWECADQKCSQMTTEELEEVFVKSITKKEVLKPIGGAFETLAALVKRNDAFVKMWQIETDIKEIYQVPYVPFAAFYQMFAQLDGYLGLAPLTTVFFNRSKSNLKWLEYTVHGMATIASRVGPYADSIEHEKTGLLIEDNRDWLDAINYLLDNPEKHAELLKNATAEVKENYDISKNYVMWQNALSAVLKM